MIKRFCDICKVEIISENVCSGAKTTNGRLGMEKFYGKGDNKFKAHFEVLHGQNNTSNTGDYCKYCVIDAINSLDDRPKRK